MVRVGPRPVTPRLAAHRAAAVAKVPAGQQPHRRRPKRWYRSEVAPETHLLPKAPWTNNSTCRTTDVVTVCVHWVYQHLWMLPPSRLRTYPQRYSYGPHSLRRRGPSPFRGIRTSPVLSVMGTSHLRGSSGCRTDGLTRPKVTGRRDAKTASVDLHSLICELCQFASTAVPLNRASEGATSSPKL